jgi:hypothetical protein
MSVGSILALALGLKLQQRLAGGTCSRISSPHS